MKIMRIPKSQNEDAFGEFIAKMTHDHAEEMSDACYLVMCGNGRSEDGGINVFRTTFDPDDFTTWNLNGGGFDAHKWNNFLASFIIDAGVAPQVIAIIVGATVTRFHGDMELGEFAVAVTMTWIRHEVRLVPADDSTDEHTAYATSVFTDPEKEGLLEGMVEVSRQYLIRRG